jgi:hypothetical protein
VLKGKKDAVMIRKPGCLVTGNTNVVRCIILHTVPIIRPGLRLENSQKKHIMPQHLVLTVKHGGESVDDLGSNILVFYWSY